MVSISFSLFFYGIAVFAAFGVCVRVPFFLLDGTFFSVYCFLFFFFVARKMFGSLTSIHSKSFKKNFIFFLFILVTAVIIITVFLFAVVVVGSFFF